jgi:hypothetical protein
MTAEDQNDSADQNFMSVQEQIDQESNYMQLGTDDKYDAQSKVIKNVATGVADTDAVNKLQVTTITAADASAAAASAAAAAASEAVCTAKEALTDADATATAADAAATAQDAIDTAADAVSTAADAVSTAADAAATAADLVLTDADQQSCAADAATVAADKATVAADKATVAADKALTLGYKNDAETAKTAAETAETNAETAESMAEEWAEKAEDSAITGHPGQYSALHWAAKAAADNPVTAIHDNVSGEINAITSKTTPLNSDLLLIEDAASSYAKKKCTPLELEKALGATAATGDRLARRTTQGYVNASFFNHNGGVTTATPSHVNVETGSDGYIRRQTFANFASKIGAQMGWKWANIVHRGAANSSGGSTTLGAWYKIPYNVEESDPNGITSLSSNRFTLQAGTYIIYATHSCFAVHGFQLRIRNYSAGTTVATGPQVSGSQTDSGSEALASVLGFTTITTSRAFEIDYICKTSRTSTGLGKAKNQAGTYEYWGQIVIFKLP